MTVDTWSALVGILLPGLVAIINHENWKSWIKAIIALAASVVVGTVTALLSGGFSGATWVQAVGVVFVASQVAYHTWWKNSDISSWIERSVNVISGKTVDQPK